MPEWMFEVYNEILSFNWFWAVHGFQQMFDVYIDLKKNVDSLTNMKINSSTVHILSSDEKEIISYSRDPHILLDILLIVLDFNYDSVCMCGGGSQCACVCVSLHLKTNLNFTSVLSSRRRIFTLHKQN